MFSSTGFLGTKAALYMDLATLYFAILPLLVIYSIRFAIKKEYVKHYRSQILVFAMTLLMVVVFEIGVRLEGGFFAFIEHSSVSQGFMSVFMVVHILIALVTVLAWIYLMVKSYAAFQKEGVQSTFFKQHRKLARYVFAGIAITSVMGVSIYIFLFLL